MATGKTPSMRLVAGDTFYAEAEFNTANEPDNILLAEAIVEAQEDYEEALAADPQVPADVSSTLLAVQTAQAAYDAAVVVDITGWTFEVEVTRRGRHVAYLIASAIDPTNGKISMTLPATDTADWHHGINKCSIETTNALGIVLSTETFYIKVE